MPAEIPVAAVGAAPVLMFGLSIMHAVAAALCTASCMAALKVMRASRRWRTTAEGTARLASVLANQASVAVTVTDALRRAADVVHGPIGEAAADMASDAETLGVDVAAERFYTRVAYPCGPLAWCSRRGLGKQWQPVGPNCSIARG